VVSRGTRKVIRQETDMVESGMSGREDTVHVVVVGDEMGLGMVIVVSCG